MAVVVKNNNTRTYLMIVILTTKDVARRLFGTNGRRWFDCTLIHIVMFDGRAIVACITRHTVRLLGGKAGPFPFWLTYTGICSEEAPELWSFDSV